MCSLAPLSANQVFSKESAMNAWLDRIEVTTKAKSSLEIELDSSSEAPDRHKLSSKFASLKPSSTF